MTMRGNNVTTATAELDHKKQGLESRNEDSSHITRIPEPPDLTLSSPHIDDCTPAGRLARSKLLRTWVELEAWVANCSKRFAPATQDTRQPP
ncbi:hypothetical protein EI94DRAFT_1760513 [Lactarius quietus]|nr:hypothetical protein EI94DRAFT_1760513 [Lactarius quietus]